MFSMINNLKYENSNVWQQLNNIKYLKWLKWIYLKEDKIKSILLAGNI